MTYLVFIKTNMKKIISIILAFFLPISALAITVPWNKVAPGQIYPPLVNDSVGVGTTTPTAQLTIASSTNWQLALSQGLGVLQWVVTNLGGNLYLSTTTVAGTATTSISALEIAGNGFGTTTVRGLNISGQATSTSNVGIRISAGCYAVGNNCIGTGAGTVTSVAASGGTTGLSFTGSPITTAGTLTLTAPFSPNSIITSNSSGNGLIATGTQLTTGNIVATSTATSTYAAGIDAARVCITGTTNCLGAGGSGTVSTNNYATSSRSDLYWSGLALVSGDTVKIWGNQQSTNCNTDGGSLLSLKYRFATDLSTTTLDFASFTNNATPCSISVMGMVTATTTNTVTIQIDSDNRGDTTQVSLLAEKNH